MKILWFTNVPISSNNASRGTGTWLNTLSGKLSNNSKLYICYYDTVDQEFNSESIKIHTIKKSFFRKIGNFLPFEVSNRYEVAKYLSVIESIKPDVIHIHGTENTFIEILKNKKNLPPIIVSIQGNISIYKQMYFRGITFFNCLITFNYFPLLYYLWFTKISNFENKYLKNLEYVIGRTDWDFRISRVFAPNSQYFKVGEILRNDFYKFEWINTKKTGKLVLFTTSADIIYKGFEVICQSLSLLIGMGLNVEWKVAGISKGDAIVRTTKFLLGSRFPQSGLRLLGNLTSNALVDEMLESDIYISVSHIENSPNSLCEAMLLGMPCIASSVGGISSLIEDKIDGILIQDGDQWALAGAIVDLTFNYENVAINLGKAARRKAIIRHNEEYILNDLLSAYSSIIN